MADLYKDDPKASQADGMDENADLSRRAGKFTIATEFLKYEPVCVADAMSGGVVLYCIHRQDQQLFEYVMLHPKFDPIEPGIEPPEYTCLFTRHPDGCTTIEWRRERPA